MRVLLKLKCSLQHKGVIEWLGDAISVNALPIMKIWVFDFGTGHVKIYFVYRLIVSCGERILPYLAIHSTTDTKQFESASRLMS